MANWKGHGIWSYPSSARYCGVPWGLSFFLCILGVLVPDFQCDHEAQEAHAYEETCTDFALKWEVERGEVWPTGGGE